MNPPAPISYELAVKVIEYLELARNLKANSPASEYRRANMLSWELALCLPAELYRFVARALVHPSDRDNPLTVVAAMRNMLLGVDDLGAADILAHAPNIGKMGHQ